jgi:hypothetical protein
MQVLNLDLDCFISGIANFRSDDGNRLDDAEHPPWSVSEFRGFLENRCNLSMSAPLKGAVVREHVEVLTFWQKLITEGRLTVPFELVHVDAHSDMGSWEESVGYLLHTLLLVPRHQRTEIDRNSRYVTSGSYLSFVLAAGWISKLTFVHHRDFLDHDDFVLQYFKDFDPASGYIQMKGYKKRPALGEFYNDMIPTLTDPDIPFSMCSVDEFTSDSSFDIATLSQSPGFTAQSADTLLKFFRSYIV